MLGVKKLEHVWHFAARENPDLKNRERDINHPIRLINLAERKTGLRFNRSTQQAEKPRCLFSLIQDSCDSYYSLLVSWSPNFEDLTARL